ncbi:MAG: alpha amylase C-terminal domain-containing protein [Candidatus Acidiferrales bacterium]
MQSALSEFDLYLLAEGTHYRAYEKLGAHLAERDDRRGVQFAVWAPNAKRVSVTGDFNNWNPAATILRPSAASIWDGFVPGVGQVVYGKGSMLSKMPGDNWQKFANLRLLYGFMFGHPGKKLLFMGDEFGQCSEWNHDASLEWQLLQDPFHAGLKRWVRDLNTLYRGEPLLHEMDFNSAGFEWVDCKDFQRSIISFLRRGRNPGDQLLFVCNFTPVARHNYRVGVPAEGYWREILNSDADLYGGCGQGNLGGLTAVPLPIHGRPFSLNMTLPPLGIVVFRPESRSVA